MRVAGVAEQSYRLKNLKEMTAMANDRDGDSKGRVARHAAIWLTALGAAGILLLAPERAAAQWGTGYGGYRSSWHAPYDPYWDGGYYPGSRTYFGTTTPRMFPGGLGYEYNYPGGYYETYPHSPYDRHRPHPHSALQVGPHRYEYWH